MATVAKLVVEMAADPQGVRTGLDKAEGYLRQFGRSADAALATAGRGASGSTLADNILGNLENTFRSGANRVREQLFRGILSPAEAKVAAREAALAMNATILATLSELRGRGLATPEIEHQLIGQLTNVGGAIESAGTRGGLGLSRIRQGLTSLVAQFTGTIPVLDRIGVSLLGLGAGTEMIIAAVAGIAAIAYAWMKFTEHTREATKAMQEFQKTAEAMGPAARAAGIIAATAAGAGGNTVKSLPLTEEIKKAQLAVEGLKNALGSARTPLGFATGTSGDVVAFERSLAAGKITVKEFSDAMQRLAATRAGAINSQAIADASALAAEYKAAGEMVAKLTAAEQQRHAVEVSNKTTFGVTPGLGQDLDNANRRLSALRAGGLTALHAVEDSITATEKADAAWQTYVTTADGAKFSTLAFRDAIRLHNTEAVRMYGAALQTAEAVRKVSEGVKDAKKSLRDFEQEISQLISLSKTELEIEPFRGPSAQAFLAVNRLYDMYGKLKAAELTAELADPWSEQTIKLRLLRAELEKYVDTLVKVGTAGGLPVTHSVPKPDSFPGNRDVGPQSFIKGFNGAPGFPLPAIQPASFIVPGGPFRDEKDVSGPSINTARLRVVVAEIADTAHAVGSRLRELAADTGWAILRSIAGQLNPFAQVISAISTAAKPLAPFMQQLANIVATVLGPVFEAFAPVIEALLPVFDALLRVIAPILRALAPLFMALVPILEALFPVIKLAAIVFTYVVQAAAFLAGVLFKIAGGFTTLIGGVIAAIGAIISKIPFLGSFGRSIQAVGNDIKNFGHALDATADGMFETADAMAKARDEINKVNVDETQTKIDALGDAAQKATGGLLNVPLGYKIALARFNATTPVNGPGANPPLSPQPPHLTPVGGGPKFDPNAPSGEPGSGTPPGGGGETPGNEPIKSEFSFAAGSIVINARDYTPSELFEAMLREGQRRARAAFGDETKWAEVQS